MNISHYSAPLAARLAVLEQDNRLSQPARDMIASLLTILEKRDERCGSYVGGSFGQADAWRAICVLEADHKGEHLYKIEK